ncbi:MAG: hypothetical protein DWQ04_30305 [Chloroflexi bacterium]|nr:MAG: hypothetical protein DWQ04_30305 [Chloroflexota bacterium]
MSQDLMHKVAAMHTIQVGDDTYLSYDAVLTETANHLFSDGPQSESDFQQITEQAGRLLTQLGYGSPVTLNPPAVPFNQRGTYYRKMPQLDTVVVQAALDQLSTLCNSKPEHRVIAVRLMLNVAKRLGHTSFDHLETGLREHITNQVTKLAADLGWTFYDSGIFAKPRPFDTDKAKTAVSTHLTKTDGPVWHSDLLNTAVSAGYGHSFYYLEEPDPAIEEIIQTTLIAHNYETTADNDCYRPKLPVLPTDTQPQLLDGLRQLQIYSIDDKHNRDMLHVDEVQHVLNQVLGQSTTEYQFQRFLSAGPLANALIQLGYERDTTTLPTSEIRPFSTRFQTPNLYHPFLRKEVVAATNDPPQMLHLADGMTVHAPIITLDDDEETIVALQMIGPEQSVKANWAALMGGGKTN